MTVPKMLIDLKTRLDHGSGTEAELATAAAMYQKALTKWGLTDDDVAVTSSDVPIFTTITLEGEGKKAWLNFIAMGVASSLGGSAFTSRRVHKRTDLCLILPHKVAGEGEALLHRLAAEVEILTVQARKEGRIAGRSQIDSFRKGMAARLQARLVEAAREARAEVERETSTALVVAQEEAYRDYCNEQGYRFRSTTISANDAYGYHSGTAAADGVALSGGGSIRG